MREEQKGIKVLHVDDEPDFLALTKAFLEREHAEFSIDTATSAEEAIELLKGGKYDMVVSDYQMPVMDGLEFLKTLRQSGNTIPFIMFTGKGREEVAIEALNRGANHYLQKGTDITSMYVTLAHAIKQEAETKRVGDALRESEEKYRATFEHTGTCMAILEEDATVSLVNSQFEELSGYSKEEIEGKMRWTKFVHPDDVKRMFEYHKKRRQNPDGVPKEYEFRALNKSGDIFNMLIDIGMIPGTKKSVISLVDVTELKQVEETINRRLEFEKTVSTISTRFVGVSDIDDAINASLKDVSKLSGASRAYVFLFREDRTTMDNTHEWCAEGVSPQIDNLKNLPVEAFPWLLSLYKAGEAIHIKDVSKMPAEAKTEKEILETQDIKSLLLFPLSVRGKFAGCVGFDNVVKTDEWNNEDIMTLRIFSGILGTAFERKRAEEALRHLVEFEGIITALSTNFINLASDEIDDGINQALRTTGEFSGVVRDVAVLPAGKTYSCYTVARCTTHCKSTDVHVIRSYIKDVVA